MSDEMKSGPNTQAILAGMIERAERLIEQRKEISADISDVFTEARLQGFDPKALKTLIRERGLDPQEVAEQRALVDAYGIGLKPKEKVSD